MQATGTHREEEEVIETGRCRRPSHLDEVFSARCWAKCGKRPSAAAAARSGSFRSLGETSFMTCGKEDVADRNGYTEGNMTELLVQRGPSTCRTENEPGQNQGQGACGRCFRALLTSSR